MKNYIFIVTSILISLILIHIGSLIVDKSIKRGTRAYVQPIHYYLWDIPTNQYVMGTYPIFEIPLDGQHGYCDFELKASTNNFMRVSASNELDNIVYWYDSLGNTFPEFTQLAYKISDLHANVFFCNTGSHDAMGDSRSYVQVSYNSALGSQIDVTATNYQHTVLISPSHTVPGASEWMLPTNEKLIWVYRRRSVNAGERTASGRSIWHPIYPVEWKQKQFNPL